MGKSKRRWKLQNKHCLTAREINYVTQNLIAWTWSWDHLFTGMMRQRLEFGAAKMAGNWGKQSSKEATTEGKVPKLCTNSA